MKIISKIENIPRSVNPVVTIGTFDGIHLGHQQIIKHLLEKKRNYQGTSFLITFEPHPQIVLQSKAQPVKILTTLEEKLEYLKNFDLDYVIVLEFTRELSRMTGEDFINRVLLEKIGMIDIVIGYDHAFGYKRSGNIQTLQALSGKAGFKVNVVEPFLTDGEIIKSTLIRNLIGAGNVSLARQFFGRPYQITGQVVAGKGRGRRLNYPTANLNVNDENKLIPGYGIYATKIEYDNKIYDSAVSIGIRPTFKEQDRTIEAYIFNFDEDVYGKQLTVRFIDKIREEKKFSSSDELVRQMELDVRTVKQVLSTINS